MITCQDNELAARSAFSGSMEWSRVTTIISSAATFAWTKCRPPSWSETAAPGGMVRAPPKRCGFLWPGIQSRRPNGTNCDIRSNRIEIRPGTTTFIISTSSELRERRSAQGTPDASRSAALFITRSVCISSHALAFSVTDEAICRQRKKPRPRPWPSRSIGISRDANTCECRRNDEQEVLSEAAPSERRLRSHPLGDDLRNPKPLATRGTRAYINARSEGRYRSGQTGRTVNPLAYAFAGSNPALPIFPRTELVAFTFSAFPPRRFAPGTGSATGFGR